MKAKGGMLIAILFVFTATFVLHAQTPAPSTNAPRTATAGPFAESPSQPAIYYRLDFVIREMNREKLVDTRNYSLWVQSGIPENMTAGSEVPYPGGAYSTAGGTTKNIQYRSVGVSISCTVKEGTENPQLDLKLNISDALPPEKDSDTPAFRKITLDSRALLTLGKPVTVSIVEDPGSRNRYQVDVTATKVK